MGLREEIDRALENAGLLVTGWVLVAAVVDRDAANEYLIREESETLPDWTRRGMLEEAIDSDEWDQDDAET